MVGPTANSPLFTDAGRGPARDSLTQHSMRLEHLQLILHSSLSISLNRGSFILFLSFIFQCNPIDSLSSILYRGSFIVYLEVEFK
jgi:hypothetical protein